jgi:hypothetical protein
MTYLSHIFLIFVTINTRTIIRKNMAQYSKRQNIARTIPGILAGLYSGFTLGASLIAIIVSGLIGAFISYSLVAWCKIKNRWGRGIIIALTTTYSAGLFHTAHIITHQGRHIMTQPIKFLLSSGIIALISLTSWVIALLIFIFIDYLISRLIRPKHK